jgi:hypothetical protein
MATFFNTFVQNVDTSKITALTSTSDSTIILSIICANTDGASTEDITVQQDDSSDTIETYLAFTIPVPADSNLDILSNKYILPSGKKLGVLASASGSIDVTISYVEV